MDDNRCIPCNLRGEEIHVYSVADQLGKQHVMRC